MLALVGVALNAAEAMLLGESLTQAWHETVDKEFLVIVGVGAEAAPVLRSYLSWMTLGAFQTYTESDRIYHSVRSDRAVTTTLDGLRDVFLKDALRLAVFAHEREDGTPLDITAIGVMSADAQFSPEWDQCGAELPSVVGVKFFSADAPLPLNVLAPVLSAALRV